MGFRSEQLAMRKRALLLKCSAQRQLFALQGRELKQSLLWADIGINLCKNAAHQFRQKPAWGIGLAAAILVLKPQRTLAVLKTALTTWQLWSRFAPLLNRLRDKAAQAGHSAQTPEA